MISQAGCIYRRLRRLCVYVDTPSCGAQQDTCCPFSVKHVSGTVVARHAGQLLAPTVGSVFLVVCASCTQGISIGGRHNTHPKLHDSVCKTLLSTLAGVPRLLSLLPCCHSSICQAAAENTTNSIAAVLGQAPACSRGSCKIALAAAAAAATDPNTNKQTNSRAQTHSTVTCWHLTQPTCLKSTHTCKTLQRSTHTPFCWLRNRRLSAQPSAVLSNSAPA